MTSMSRIHDKQAQAHCAALARHEDYLERYLCWLGEQDEPAPEQKLISIIARSPASPVIQAVGARRGCLAARGVQVTAILAALEPHDLLRTFCDTLMALGGGELSDLARWARRPSLRDANEQIIFGRAMCWSGDAMRREPGRCNGLDLFEDDAPQTVRLGGLAFRSIWDICEPVPAARLRPGANGRPVAAYGETDPNRLAAFSFLRRLDPASLLRH